MSQSSTRASKTFPPKRRQKLAADRQRRLTELLDKNGERALTVAERRELQALLDEVDRKTFWRLAEMVMSQSKSRTRRAAS